MKSYKQLNRGIQMLLFGLSPILTAFFIGGWAILALFFGVIPMLFTAIASLIVREIVKQDSAMKNNISWVLVTMAIGFTITSLCFINFASDAEFE